MKTSLNLYRSKTFCWWVCHSERSDSGVKNLTRCASCCSFALRTPWAMKKAQFLTVNTIR